MPDIQKLDSLSGPNRKKQVFCTRVLGLVEINTRDEEENPIFSGHSQMDLG